MANQYFIAVSADPTNRFTIDGIGHSASAAEWDAVHNAGFSSNENLDSLRRDTNGDLILTHFVGQECTKALHDLVERVGGAGLGWERNAEGLQDVSMDADE